MSNPYKFWGSVLGVSMGICTTVFGGVVFAETTPTNLKGQIALLLVFLALGLIGVAVAVSPFAEDADASKGKSTPSASDSDTAFKAGK